MVKKENTSRRLFRLDNAAHIYPAIKNQKQPGVFRVSATLYEPVHPGILQQALNVTLKRIPGFSVKLRPGLFWNYFVHTDDALPIQEDVQNPCMEITKKENDGFLLRVRYHGCRIALEAFHSVTDGSGALTFLKTLVAQYFRLQGITIPAEKGVLDCTSPPKPEEVQDSFRPFALGTHRIRRKELRAYQIKGTSLPPHNISIIRGTIPLEEIRKAGKRHNVSITEFLTAALLYNLNGLQLCENPYKLLPVRVQVPVNLRGHFETETLRNFSSFINVELEPRLGDYSFEEVLKLVHHFLRFEVNEKFLRSRVAANLRTEGLLFLRVVPLMIKNPMIGLGYKIAGPNTFTSILSNLGNIDVPHELAEYVKKFDIVLGASKDTAVKCAVSGFKGSLRVNFTSSIEEAMVERAFFTFLVGQGIPVEVESNQE